LQSGLDFSFKTAELARSRACESVRHATHPQSPIRKDCRAAINCYVKTWPLPCPPIGARNVTGLRR
jgi:hypothetical protein